VHDGKLARVEERLERREARVKSEVFIEIERRLVGRRSKRRSARPSDADSRTRRIVVGVAVRNDDIQTVERGGTPGCLLTREHRSGALPDPPARSGDYANVDWRL
jgi:hypothetical protein